VIVQHSTALPLPFPKRIWRLPTLTVARFVLWSYLRSGWVLADIVYLWFLYALLFSGSGGDAAYFYGAVSPWLYALAILDTAIIVQRSLKTARVYLPLSRLSSRSIYIRGVIAATAIWRIPIFIVMLGLSAGYHKYAPSIGIYGATLGNMLPGAIGLLLNCMLLSTLTVLLLAPVGTRRIQIVFLAWLMIVLYASTHFDIVSQYLVVLRIPLNPFFLCYSVGLNGTIDLYGIGMMILTAAYIFGLILLAQFWLSRRDLILH
jgi:hypothetical protein